ncbi:hypothetical protein BGW37DRAFT_507736 [Umbelopsis sp. PMI_123]|nr:hypothetical protein BGW37DRAFT_507736 [Umbelopsis sp. PMI_123]
MDYNITTTTCNYTTAAYGGFLASIPIGILILQYITFAMNLAVRPVIQKMCYYRRNDSQLYRFNVSYLSFLFVEFKQLFKDMSDLLERSYLDTGAIITKGLKIFVIWILYNGILAISVFFTPIVTAASAYASIINQVNGYDSNTNTTSTYVQVLWHSSHGDCVSTESSLYYQTKSGIVMNIWMVAIFGGFFSLLIIASFLFEHRANNNRMFPLQLHDLLLVSPVTGHRDAAPRYGTKSPLLVKNIDGKPFITVDQRTVVAVDRDQARTLYSIMAAIEDDQWPDERLSEFLLQAYEKMGDVSNA